MFQSISHCVGCLQSCAAVWILQMLSCMSFRLSFWSSVLAKSVRPGLTASRWSYSRWCHVFHVTSIPLVCHQYQQFCCSNCSKDTLPGVKILFCILTRKPTRQLYLHCSFDDERRCAKIITGWIGRVGMPSKSLPFLILKVRYPAMLIIGFGFLLKVVMVMIQIKPNILNSFSSDKNFWCYAQWLYFPTINLTAFIWWWKSISAV